MVDDVTLEVIARNLNIDIKTALYYRYLVFESLRDYKMRYFYMGQYWLMKHLSESVIKTINCIEPMAKE